MATGTGNLPNQNMSFSPFAILTAEEMNDLVENIESLADASGIGDGAIDTTQLADDAVTSAKIDFTTFASDPDWDSGWVNITLNSGFTSDQTPRYRRIGGIVYFQGRVTRTAGLFPNTATNFATLPVGYRPSQYTRINGGSYASVTANNTQVYIETNGVMGGYSVGTGSDTVYLGGISYPA